MPGSDEKSFGVMVNSFYELETAYVDSFRNDLGSWDQFHYAIEMWKIRLREAKRLQLNEQTILSWLDSKELDSVLDVSFGSLARLAPEQILEIAHGLEASNHPFIWVIGKILKSTGQNGESKENLLPSGLEDRIKESRRGLIIRGWAPQLLILEHPAVGGFVTHCGWNSTLEGVSAGMPMVTWSVTAEQFTNEKLITDVLKIGVKVGSMHWMSPRTESRVSVGRDKVEAAVKRLMGSGEEAAEMRRRAEKLGVKAKIAVEEGGSSCKNADALIQELKSRRQS